MTGAELIALAHKARSILALLAKSAHPVREWMLRQDRKRLAAAINAALSAEVSDETA
jgi:hypothetical protein